MGRMKMKSKDMTKLGLVVDVNGRDAIPVRALCFADDLKRLSPDLVAQAAAGEDHYEGTWRLPTYHLSEGSVIELKASQWAYCCRRLKAISSRLKSTWGDADSWDLWRSEATPVLPAGVFVWLDEFREWYERTRPWRVKKDHQLLAHPEGDEQHDHVVNDVLKSIVRPWDIVDDDLSLVQPTLSEGDYSMAMEGFPLASESPAAPTPGQPVGIDAEPVATQTKEAKRPGRPRSTAPKLLEEILAALEIYAAHTNQVFDRDAMPGPVGDNCDHEGSFHWLCAAIYPATFMQSHSTFERQRNGVCRVRIYAEPTRFYSEALPHIASILGVKLNVRKRSNRAVKAA